MQTNSVSEVDHLAEQMYSNPDPIIRQQSQTSLESLTKENADISFLFTILQQSNNQYTLLFMAQSLVLWFTSTRKWLSENERRDLVVLHCGGCLKRVFESGAPKHVLTSLLVAYAKLTKLSFEEEPFLEAAVEFPLEMIIQGTEGSSSKSLGLMMLNTMVMEFSKFVSNKTHTYLSFVAHRHCSCNFKEKSLLNIFLMIMKQLEVLETNSPHIEDVVKLVENCMSYDFRGIMVDETEDLPFVQFPASWKSTMLNENNLRTLWGQHAVLPYPHCSNLFAGIANICGIHRTFFDSTEERSQFLQYILGMLTDVALIQDGRLKIPQYVELFTDACRRLVLSFGYRDLRVFAAFESWVTAMRDLSMEVLSISFGQEGSFGTSTTIMNFWVALTTSKRRSYSEQGTRDIEEVIPQVLQSFLISRIHSSERSTGTCSIPINDFENDNSYMDSILSQSDAFATICLIDSVTCLNNLANYLNQSVGMSILSSPSSAGWLFYIAGSIMRIVLLVMEDISVEPCSHVLVYVTGCANHRLRREGDPAMFSSFVERGVLHFLTNAQLILTGARQGNLSAVVANVFQGRAQLFQFVLDNVGHNLLRGAEDAEAADIIKASADVITDACREVPPSILQELSFDLPPTSELPLAQSERTYKLRTNLMRALWFLRKTGPSTRERMEAYLSHVEMNIQQTVNNDVTNPSFVAGWLRDLRGACQALNEDENIFGDFLDWFFAHCATFNLVLDMAGDSSVVIVAFMRFLCEFVTPGRYGRMNISSSTDSAVGLVLFKYICALILKVEEKSFPTECLSSHNRSSLSYDKTLKPWMLAMEIMKRCILSSFVPFGAMLYYNDDTFETSTVSLIQKITLIEPNVFKEYSKFTAHTIDFLRSLTEENLYFPLRHLSSNDLLSLVRVVVLVCEDPDAPSGVLLHGLSFLSFIAGLIKEVKALMLNPLEQQNQQQQNQQQMSLSTSGTPPPLIISPMMQPFIPQLTLPINIGGGGPPLSQSNRAPRFAREVRSKLAELLAPHEELWQRLISTGMNIIAFQERAVSASSAVVYPIFEAHPPFWFQYVEKLVASYPERKQGAVREAISTLTNAAETQEKFFSEVFAFRQALRRVNS